VNFKNTIIIMTSNLRQEQLRTAMRPEFLNRIDEVIVFQPLQQEEIRQVVQLQIRGIQKMLEQNGVQLEVTPEAIDFLARVGYDPDFGARPVKRAIQRYLLNDLSKALLGTGIDRERPIVVEAEDDRLTFRN
jgi:ATP-dependent Clp protease ATP-binding subunit ClpB